MKLLTSYSSPSSSSTLSLDSTFCHSRGANATAGCLTGILRRILRSRGLPTHPADQIRDVASLVKGKDQELKAKEKTKATSSTNTTLSTPGIVARLMGLESMGEVPSESSPSSLSRSRSINSVECLGECKRMHGRHRRVKSTSSFREVPTFHLLENENFLVLSFEDGGESKEFKSKGKKKEMGSAELKKKRAERGEFKKNKREKVCDERILTEKEKLRKRVSGMSSGNVGNDDKLQDITNTSPPSFKVSSEKWKYFDSEAGKFSQHMKRKEVKNGEKLKKRKKKRTVCYTEKKIEIECNSEDSSPVSVLDFERKAPGTEVDSLAVGLSWRRKLSPELENDQHPLFLLHSDANLMIEEIKVKENQNNKYERPKEKEKQSQEHVDCWGEICRLAEDELVGSYQIQAGISKQGEFKGISADFESEIFDHLLNELIDQLVELPLKTSATSKFVK